MKIQNKKIIASILFVLMSFVCLSQKDSVPDPNGNRPPPPPGTPIDAGVYIIMGLAVAYGTYKKVKQ